VATLYMEGVNADPTADRLVKAEFAPCAGAPYLADQVQVTVLKVDLDVDADYDNTVSVDNPDDPIEVSAGGIVCVGKRDELVLRKVAPTTWSGDVLLTKKSTKIRVFDAATGGTEITFNGTDNKYASSALPKTLYVQGETASTAQRDVTLTLTSDPGGCDDEVRYTVLRVDMDAMEVSHNAANGELPENQETDPGAFVPINNDDDDYDASNTADKDQSGAVTGESDLLPIKLHKVDPVIAGSKYTLDIPGQVKIWQNADRSGAVSGTTEFDANADINLYVEGFTVGSGNVNLNWKNGTTTLDDCDEIKVTVFNWLGPLNVPGYAIYRYTASGALGTSKWITPNSGTIKTGTDTSDVTILWDGGPVVGKAIYQANADYIWDLEVNVVQVKIKQMGNSAAYNSTPFQVGGAGGAVIKASSQANCMTANVVVEEVEGPTVSSAQRGKKFMELGIVHQAGFDAKHGLFNDTTPKKRRRSSLQDGQTHWDAAAVGTIPWVFTDTDHYLNITSDATPISDKEFKTFDNPQISCTDQFTLGGDQVDVLAPNMFHVLYLAVRTKQNVNNSHDVIAQRGKLNWRFNGTGGVDGSGAWTLTGNGVTGDASFSEIQSGDNVPKAAANLNEAFSTQTWTTENQ